MLLKEGYMTMLLIMKNATHHYGSNVTKKN